VDLTRINSYVKIGHRITLLVFWMILGYLAGDKGMGFYFSAFVIFNLLFSVLLGGIRDIMDGMSRKRKSERFHDDAKVIFRWGMLISLAVGAISAVAFWFFGSKIMSSLYGYILPYSILGVFGVYFLLYAVSECMTGYYMSHGNTLLYIIIEVINSIVLLVGAPIVIKKMYVYGSSVGALLKEPLYSNINAAIGAVLVQCLAAVVSIILVFIGLLLELRNSIDDFESRKLGNADQKYRLLEKIGDSALTRIFPILAITTMSIIFIKAGYDLSANTGELFSSVGVFAGKYLIVIGFPFIFFVEFINERKRDLKGEYGDTEKARKSIVGYLIKNTLYIMMPICATVIVLAKPIVMIFFGGKMALGTTLVRMGGIVILLASISYTCKVVLGQVANILYALISELAGFVALLVFLLPSVSSGLNINLLIYSLIIFYVVEAVVSSILVFRFVDFSLIDLGIKAIKVLIGTIVLVIIEAMLDKMLVMNVIFLLLTLLISFVAYYFILAMIGGISKSDIKSLNGSLAYYPTSIIGGIFHGR